MAGRKALGGALPLLCAALLSGCGRGVLDPQGPVGEGNRQILLNSLAVMLVIVVPTIIGALWFAWWFRASNPKARYDPTFTYSGRIELIVWSIPTLTILFLGGLIYYGSHQLDPRRSLGPADRTLEVQVVALDWKWLFIYPDRQVATVNELRLPAGVPVRFRLTSASVMNVFFVPQLGTMIYAMNGMESELNLQADHVGQLYGQGAHYSGAGFPGMNFTVHVLAQDDFDQWATRLRGGTAVLNAETYAELAQQSHDVAPFAYSQVQGGLFDAIVRQVLPPARGPDSGRGGEPEIHPQPLDASICTTPVDVSRMDFDFDGRG
ncbi:ubiquinol oxidase subunit II [Mesorhizobium sp. BR1-1-16]|uniref:ubiquinol oxidase subunit II n=1 Tax=Mesorhizobium sp. BR1-1-16 TaxID=2876653 RepID=UPI001CC9ECC8|nr:ubiquinol oxidase subunit II [Mesorhizobium sp. BR1-1-16]MBZ9937044.1 ubiquinol oxidase subunit II [Mesorhizobium sp. BR1-1-16]